MVSWFKIIHKLFLGGDINCKNLEFPRKGGSIESPEPPLNPPLSFLHTVAVHFLEIFLLLIYFIFLWLNATALTVHIGWLAQ